MVWKQWPSIEKQKEARFCQGRSFVRRRHDTGRCYELERERSGQIRQKLAECVECSTLDQENRPAQFLNDHMRLR